MQESKKFEKGEEQWGGSYLVLSTLYKWLK